MATQRRKSARFVVPAAPFGRAAIYRVTVAPVGAGAVVKIRRHRARGAMELGLSELVELVVERAAKRAAAERAKSRRRSRVKSVVNDVVGAVRLAVGAGRSNRGGGS